MDGMIWDRIEMHKVAFETVINEGLYDVWLVLLHFSCFG